MGGVAMTRTGSATLRQGAIVSQNEAPAAPHPRTIGWVGTTALAMGGSNQSLFLLGALIIGQGSAAIPLLAVGLLLSWAAAPGWTELALMWPNRVGGIAATCAEAFRPYSPVLANLTGVCYWWGWVPTCGVTALLSATALHAWYLPAIPTKALATALILIFLAVNLCGVRWVTRLAIPIATVSAALAFLSGAIPVLSGHVSWRQATTFHLITPFPGAFGGLTGAMAGLYLIGFAAPAFEAAACHVGETIDPARNVPRAMLASGAMATLYFVALPVVWLGLLGPGPLREPLAYSLWPTFAPLLGSAARGAAVWFIVCNMFHGTLQPLAGASRTLAQLAEDGLLPRVLARRSRTDTPWVATVLTAGMAIIVLLAGDPTLVIAAANLAYLIGIGLPSVAVWLLRRDAPGAARPYRAPRGTIGLGVGAAGVWGLATILGFEQFGLPTVLAGLALAFSGAVFYALRRWSDRRREGKPILLHSLHVKLTGAMLLVLTLDGTGYYLAVSSLGKQQPVRIAGLEDIFVAVAVLTLSVGLILPGTIAHATGEVARSAERLAHGTLADLLHAMQALETGDLDAAHARIDVDPVVVHTRDEVGAMAASFNLMQAEVAQAAMALDGAREGLRQARGDLTRSNEELAQWASELERRVVERTAALQKARITAIAHANRLDVIFNSIADGVMATDPEGRIVQANMAARMLLGLDSDPRLSALPIAERGPLQGLRDEQGRPLAPDLWPTVRILRGDVLTGAAAADIIVRASDGHDREVSVTGAPVCDETGTLVGGVTVIHDVTERRRQERRTHDALHALLHMAEALVLTSDDVESAEGAIARRLAEMAHDVLACRRVSITAIDPTSEALERVAAVGLTEEQERQWRAPGDMMSLLDLLGGAASLARFRAGEARIIDLSRPAYRLHLSDYGADTLLALPLRAGPQLVGLLTIDHGPGTHTYGPEEIALSSAVAKLVALVIERERLLRERAESRASELALRESNQRMDEFLSLASHELRTPLTTVKGYVQLAEGRLARIMGEEGQEAALEPRVAPAHQMLQRTDIHIRRLTRLIDDLVDVSRVHAGKLALRLEPCDIGAIVCEVVQAQRQLHPERLITMDVATTAPRQTVADGDRIGQVVANYLGNALKYAPPDRPIAVGFADEGSTVRVWVRDEGPGLSAHEQTRIWDRFYRVDGVSHQSGSHVGLGLGLHISQTIVERHHGRVGVESALGEGSTFWFTLPYREGFVT
jgi:signal transduction histidine kinase/amino acid transporter